MTGNDSRFADGPFSGRTLAEAWPVLPPEWAGTRKARNLAFPILVKFIFTEEKLSVQVHPDDDYASRHEIAAGGRGKTEMWYALRARPGAEVLVGLKPEITRSSFEHAIASGTAEHCLEHVPLRAGEAVFVPARTAHTIGPGLVLCEIQQNSDLTYRVYDYNRRDAQGRTRELHIAKALDVLRFGKQMGGKIRPAQAARGPLTVTFLAACRYFATEKWDFASPIRADSSPEHFDLLIFLEGSGALRWGQSGAEFGPAQVWLMPAALGRYEIVPASHASLLRSYVPGSLEEFAAGLPESERSRLVHP